MTIKVRFAPSPTGLLHVGNLRTALVNWLFARRHGGHFLLRFDDTDRERSRPEFADAIEEDLRWLGLLWDSRARQSERIDAYVAASERLRAAGRLYPCYETPDELEYKRKRQLARGRPPIYDRAALGLSADERSRLESEGRRPHWRFMLESGSIIWDDLVRGRVELQADHMSDPVVVRADGTFLYMLPSTVDDVDLAATHVIRGEDHVANTAVQIQMFRALGAMPPAFAHLPLLTDIAGRGLSKRLGSMTIASLRDQGLEAMALNGYLARLGTGEIPQPGQSLAELAADFDICAARPGDAEVRRGPARASEPSASARSPFASVAARLDALGLDHADAAFWEAIRGNLQRLGEAACWHEVCFGEITPVVADAGFAANAARLLPEEPWDGNTWNAWTKSVNAATGRKGKELFLPLRLALTGAEHGPELRALLPLIGRRKAERRLLGGNSAGRAPAARRAAAAVATGAGG